MWSIPRSKEYRGALLVVLLCLSAFLVYLMIPRYIDGDNTPEEEALLYDRAVMGAVQAGAAISYAWHRRDGLVESGTGPGKFVTTAEDIKPYMEEINNLPAGYVFSGTMFLTPSGRKFVLAHPESASGPAQFQKVGPGWETPNRK